MATIAGTGNPKWRKNRDTSTSFIADVVGETITANLELQSSAVDYLHANISRNLPLFEVARESGVHPVHLSRVFRMRFKTTMGSLVTHLRVQRSCVPLAAGSMTLCDIAADCGFADQSHFSRVFKAMLGVTPVQFRQSHRELLRR